MVAHHLVANASSFLVLDHGTKHVRDELASVRNVFTDVHNVFTNVGNCYMRVQRKFSL